jgi:hypothetical protein
LTDEGVVGKAIKKEANEVWPDNNLNPTTQSNLQSIWNLTDAQYSRTKHVTSLLSIPIYIPSDETNSQPVGVLSVDSEAPFSETYLNREEAAEELSYYANLIGTIVD